MTRDYYNEIDLVAAQWLRNLIAAGVLPPGDVDTRSIEDVRPDDLLGYRRCHFFAGIGIWAYALEEAGWPDDLPVWTGSCPCQPFSAAGKGGGFADERHLWPAFDWLIGQCRPPIIVGEQVEGKDGLVWNDLVSSDMEAKGYAFGAAIVPAAGFGVAYGETAWGEWLDRAIHDCPDPVVAGALSDFARFAGGNIGVGGYHIRHRQYWIARRLDNSAGARHEWQERQAEGHTRDEARLRLSGTGRNAGRMADASGATGERDAGSIFGKKTAVSGEDRQEHGDLRYGYPDGRPTGRMEYPDRTRAAPRLPEPSQRQERDAEVYDDGSDRLPGRHKGRPRAEPARTADAPDRVGRDADWLYCRDGSWRPVEPGAFPLAHDATARVGRLRAYGNGLDAETAIVFVKAALCAENKERLLDRLVG